MCLLGAMEHCSELGVEGVNDDGRSEERHCSNLSSLLTETVCNPVLVVNSLVSAYTKTYC